MSAPTPAPRMVGRERELATLLAAFDEGRAGHARAVMVRGEAGIGKTRLVQTFLERATASDAPSAPAVVVAIGQCVDVGPIGAPFGSIRRVLRDLHTALGTDALREAAGSPGTVAMIAAAVPALREDAEPAGDLDQGFADALEILLENLSATHHLVIVIEDLHWADASTLALLKTLARTLRGRHLTIITTHRSDDVDRFHPLRPVLAELDRSRTITRLELVPLTPEEVTDQVHLLVTHDVDDRDLATLIDRSGGIPFLVEELIDLHGDHLPDTLRDLVLARYLRLQPATQEVVRAMAAGGMHVPHDVLTAVSPLDDAQLDQALREAIDARVIVTEGAGYRFRHALTHEAVNDELLPSERVRLNRRYAERLTLDSSDPDAISAAAEHWLVARDIPRAFDTSVMALEQARATFAPATSGRILERLSELWDQVPDAAERSGMTLAQVHLGAAQAWNDLGDAERSLRAADEGLATGDDDPIVRAALLRHKFVQQVNAGRGFDRALLQEAISLLEGQRSSTATSLHSRLLTNLAMHDLELGPVGWGESPAAAHGSAPTAASEMADHLHGAIALARDVGNDAALSVALVTEARRLADVERDEPSALAPLDEARALDLTPAERGFVASMYVELLARLGRYADSADAAAEACAEAMSSGLEHSSGAEMLVRMAYADFCAGRPGDGVARALRGAHLMSRAMRPIAVRILGTHLTWNDESERRDALYSSEDATLDAWRRAYPRVRLWWTDEMADAVIAAAAGMHAAVVDDDLDARVASLERSLEVERSATTRLYAALTAAMVARALRTGVLTSHTVDSAALCDRIATAIADWPARGCAPTIIAFIRAVIADTADRPVGERVSQWRAVVEATAGGVMPARHRHLARLSLAAALIASGERDQAAALLSRIVAEAPEHGVARVGRWAAELARHAGLSAGEPGAPVPTLPDLTSRERQVLQLVAEGLTNAQIGKALFISPKTASVHVSAILAKTGAANRAEAAALFAALPHGTP